MTTGTAADVLARLVDGDPLGLRARLRRRAAERFLLASPDGLFGPAAAHCARQAEGYRGRPAPEPWLERELDAVLDRWVAGTRGRDGDSKGGAGAGGGDGRSGASARGARTGGAVGGNGVTASAARHGDGELERCARRFNACGRAERATLWRLAFAGASLDELAHESGTDLSRTARRARRALDALLGRSEVAR
ncbi:hypothetical protein [Planctomycetes bacterium Pla163]|uniref:hypothetical protein n=1 Tax=Rohdeia mirabilis TaxID=2528008 RepID=UPI0011AA5760